MDRTSCLQWWGSWAAWTFLQLRRIFSECQVIVLQERSIDPQRFKFLMDWGTRRAICAVVKYGAVIQIIHHFRVMTRDDIGRMNYRVHRWLQSQHPRRETWMDHSVEVFEAAYILLYCRYGTDPIKLLLIGQETGSGQDFSN